MLEDTALNKQVRLCQPHVDGPLSGIGKFAHLLEGTRDVQHPSIKNLLIQEV
jgi:hypothetical protein